MISEQFRALTASAALRRHRTEAARRDAELDRARQIQQSLLPRASLTRARGAFVHAKTCTEVGGDYADVIPIDADRTLLVVADVAGKGMHAALVAAQIHSLCRFSFEPGATLTDLARRLNALMASHVDSALFATAMLAIHDRANATLELINAGHPPALLAEPDGTIRPIASEPGPPLGILDETPAPTTRATTPGQSVLLYTDGLSELPAPGPALLGVDGLSALFAAHTTRDRTLDERAAALIEALTGAMDPASPQHDDETFILIDL
jgi:serine phosphatase RsbU (regulator of sigma subunit)